jgi:hypothetical protein
MANLQEFTAAAFDHFWKSPKALATLVLACATLFAGSFVIIGALLAWKSVQGQIHSAENIEKERRANETAAVEIGFKAELLVYSAAVIEASSIWNLRASQPQSYPKTFEISDWPVFPDPLFYKTNIGKIGMIRQPWVGGALIGFYANLLEFNEQAKEALSGRPTANITAKTISVRLQKMASNLAHALDGVNNDLKLPIPPEIQVEALTKPDGKWFAADPDGKWFAADIDNRPKSLQDLLLGLAGESPS